jgi:methylated-DNA-[protein]-cysteine S-methyltransferase
MKMAKSKTTKLDTAAYATTTPSPLGDIWLCATEWGICYVTFGVVGDDVRSSLARQGVALPTEGEHPYLTSAKTQLAAYFAGELRAFNLPLDLRGTDFQLSVWNLLRTIPYGKTWTYGEVASTLGRSGAARAVGQAVGANPISVIVPCHRVLGQGRTLTGYGGGLRRKRYLLELEQAAFQTEIEAES